VAAISAMFANMVNFSECGICFRNSVSGRLEGIALNYAASGAAYVAQQYLTATTYTGTPGSLTSPFAAITWLRLKRASGTYSMSFSYDKQNWIDLYSGSGYTLTPDQVGFYVNAQQNVFDSIGNLISWEEL
jgi:hypothetical protein